MFAQTQIIGRLGQDADVRYMPSGAPVANFSVATDEKWKDKQGQQQERTTWYRCALFGPVVEALEQYLKKGQLVFCEGIMQERTWQDRDGNERKSWELKVNTVKLLGGRSQGSQASGGGIPNSSAPPPASSSGSGQIPGAGTPPAADDFDDDIPF